MLTHPAFHASHQARPESLTMLLASLILLACTFGTGKPALLALSALSALIPYCGIHMVAQAFIAVAAALFYGKFKATQVVAVYRMMTDTGFPTTKHTGLHESH